MGLQHKPKNLAFFINSLAIGGAERVVLLLTQHFSKSYNVTLILLHHKIEYTLPDNVKLVFIDDDDNKNLYSKWRSFHQQARRFKEICEVQNIEFCFSFLTRCNLIAACSKKMGNNIELIINERTCLSEYNKSLGKWAGLYSKHLVKKYYLYAQQIIANSKYSANDLKVNFKLTSQKISHLYNPIDVQNIKQKSTEPVSIEGWNRNDFTFVHVGNFRPEKNHTLLLNAFSKIAHLQVSLLLVGDGPERKKY